MNREIYRGASVLIAVLLLCMVLYGCGVPSVNCPLLVQYSQLEQSVLANELPGDGPETQSQIEDYVKLRQACKAISPDQ